MPGGAVIVAVLVPQGVISSCGRDCVFGQGKGCKSGRIKCDPPLNPNRTRLVFQFPDTEPTPEDTDEPNMLTCTERVNGVCLAAFGPPDECAVAIETGACRKAKPTPDAKTLEWRHDGNAIVATSHMLFRRPLRKSQTPLMYGIAFAASVPWAAYCDGTELHQGSLTDCIAACELYEQKH